MDLSNCLYTHIYICIQKDIEMQPKHPERPKAGCRGPKAGSNPTVHPAWG